MNDKKQLAAMGEHMAEQAAQPLCTAKRIEELEAQVLVMAELLRDLREGAEIHLHNCTVCKYADGITNWTSKLERIDAAIAGKLPAPVVPEGWKMVPVEPTESMIGHGCGASVMVVSEVVMAWAAMLAAAPSPGGTK